MKAPFVILFATVAVFAASPFDGNWKIDFSSAQVSGPPAKFEVLNGMYTCSTCVPQFTVKADGTDQKVIGNPSSDTVNVQVRDHQTIEVVSKKAGKVVQTSECTVDQSGNRLTMKTMSYPPNGEPIGGNTTLTRVGKGSPGSHGTSGEWKFEQAAPAKPFIVTMKVTADGFSLHYPDGSSYDAKFDGKDYLYKGDPGVDKVSVKRINANEIEETDKKEGKVVTVARFTASPDGRSITGVNEDKRRNTKATFKFVKQ